MGALQTQTLQSLQGTPCKSILIGKSVLHSKGNPVLIAGILFSLQGFPCKTLYFPVRDCSVHTALSWINNVLLYGCSALNVITLGLIQIQKPQICSSAV